MDTTMLIKQLFYAYLIINIYNIIYILARIKKRSYADKIIYAVIYLLIILPSLGLLVSSWVALFIHNNHIFISPHIDISLLFILPFMLPLVILTIANFFALNYFYERGNKKAWLNTFFIVIIAAVATVSIQLYHDISITSMVFGNANEEAIEVSIVNLITYPELYDGKLVRVKGVSNIEFEGNGIYSSLDDFEKKIKTLYGSNLILKS